MIPTHFTDRSALFSWFDEYADVRKAELNRKDLSSDVGLLKSYLLETSPNGNAKHALQSIPWRTKSIDEGLFFLLATDTQSSLGVLEQLTERHFAFYTHLQTKDIEPQLKKTIMHNPQWDFAWFSGLVLDILWHDYILPLYPDRFTKLTFEHEARYEYTGDLENWENKADDEDEMLEEGIEDRSKAYLERRSSIIAITERSRSIQTFLPKLQAAHPPFRSLRTLRLPAFDHGGYELWNWGKMTFRAPSFTEGRSNLLTITKMYRLATESIEKLAWIQAEKLPSIGGLNLHGVPVTLQFPDEGLPQQVFEHFVKNVFGQSRNLFRLWGNPIRRTDSYYYVHAIDLHLWKPIGLELTPNYFRVLLPQGTCGNTVHRLVQNIQRYLDPTVRVFIGSIDYSHIFRQALENGIG